MRPWFEWRARLQPLEVLEKECTKFFRKLAKIQKNSHLGNNRFHLKTFAIACNFASKELHFNVLLLHELNELGMAMGVPHSCNCNDNDNICVHFRICKGQNTAASKKFPFEKEGILQMNFLARSYFCYLATKPWRKCFLKKYLCNVSSSLLVI